MDLGPACQAALDPVTGVVSREALLKLSHEVGPFGPRPDEGHLTSQDVVELGKFIEGRLSQEPSDPSKARVVADAPCRRSLCAARGPQRAKLEQIEGPALATQT